MTATVLYQGDLRTKITHVQSGAHTITDAPTDNQGKGEAFSPTDLVATALGSCMLSIIGIKMKSMSRDAELIGATVEIKKVMYSDPRRIGEVHAVIKFPKNNFSDKDKVLIEHVARTCPVALSLHPDIKQEILLEW